MEKYIMAFDAGTTSNRVIIFNKKGQIVSSAKKELRQIFPKPGYVEHDPKEIWSSIIGCAVEALLNAGLSAQNIQGIGITNQRETTIVWNKNTGEPLYNAIVWQCRRTAGMCDELLEKGYEDLIRSSTGLKIDAYFSATKLKWILENVEGARESAEKGDLLFGTVDTWLIWKLTGGTAHVTDYSNASRTMMYNIIDLKWDEEILRVLDIPASVLPDVKPSSNLYGYTKKSFFGEEIPISGAAGDQQAALFGQCCFQPGDVKNTYGTGAFLLMNTGNNPIFSSNGLVTTVAACVSEEPVYALEGSIFVAGSAVQWLRDGLRIIDSSEDSEYMATKVSSTEGCYVVPAFTGLGAPYWEQYAQGMILGITRSTTKHHIVRATLESVAYLTNDVIKAMREDSGLNINSLKVDGGMSANEFLMQFQSDIMNIEVKRPECIETTALGAAFLAGLNVGYWKDFEDISSTMTTSNVFKPEKDDEYRDKRLKGWLRAVSICTDYGVDEV